MASRPRTVLITGCSDGSLGAALAHAFHEQDCKVFPTARDPSKTQTLKDAGMNVLQLDVQSEESVKACVGQISSLAGGTLDILVNNAGGGHLMPFLHLDLQKAKEVFDLNVWSYLSVTQAFLPLLLKDAGPGPKGRHPIIVNNTSISSVLKTPFYSAYSASKAAMSMFNDVQRVELGPLGVRVVDLKTGSLVSNFVPNLTNEEDIPTDSPYSPIRDGVMHVITGQATESYAEDQDTWAKNVVRDLLKDDPPYQIWRGGMAGTISLATKIDEFIPTRIGDLSFQRIGQLDKLEQMNREKSS